MDEKKEEKKEVQKKELKTDEVPTKMMAAVLNSYTGVKTGASIREDFPVPKITGDFNVLIEVHAGSINPIDYKIALGGLKPVLPYQMPVALGYDLSGIVVSVGKKVTKFKRGDEVYGRVGSIHMGTLAEYALANEGVLAMKPRNLTHVEACSIPLVGLTTMQAFQKMKGIKKGDSTFINAGAGGVGTFALQYAKKVLGLHVSTTASEGAGHNLCASLGADTIIDYKKKKFYEELKDIDCMYDLSGEFAEGFKIVKEGGYVISIAGPLDSDETSRKFGPGVDGSGFKLSSCLMCCVGCILDCKANPVKAAAAKKKIHYAGLLMTPSSADLEILAGHIENGLIVPVVDKVFPLKEAVEALVYLESGRAKGKVVVKVRD